MPVRAISEPREKPREIFDKTQVYNCFISITHVRSEFKPCSMKKLFNSGWAMHFMHIRGRFVFGDSKREKKCTIEYGKWLKSIRMENGCRDIGIHFTTLLCVFPSCFANKDTSSFRIVLVLNSIVFPSRLIPSWDGKFSHFKFVNV